MPSNEIHVDRELGYTISPSSRTEPVERGLLLLPTASGRISSSLHGRLPRLSSSEPTPSSCSPVKTSSHQSFVEQAYGSCQTPACVKRLDDSDVSSQAVKPRRQWEGVTRTACNLLGTSGFVVGSLLWCMEYTIYGAVVFAIACILSGISQAIYGWQFYVNNDAIGLYAMLQNGIGCVVFSIASFLSLSPDYEMLCLIGYLFGSLFFLTGCMLTQVQHRLWLGVLAPVLPNSPKLIPTGLLNTIGSGLFTIGSVVLFYDWGFLVAGYSYEIGSILFFIASWGDAVLWWNLRDSIEESSSWNDYTAVLNWPNALLKNNTPQPESS